ncbi:hypothetical protein [Streptomyces mexicanus]|uniref:hypothetical protein n=1 Tax=Streptomyces mexicanus TaxID=178566 RepID=UPI0031E636E4
MAPRGESTREGRAAAAVPAAVPAALALAVGWWGIDRQGSMWRDESVTYQVAHRTLADTWHLLGHIDAVHGLYYLILHGVFAVWDGGGLPALRLPSVLGTAVAAAGVGTIGARLAGNRCGVLAGTCYVLLPVTQQYAQEGRSYALVTAAVTWATYVFVRTACTTRARERTGQAAGATRARGWAAYAALLTLACWLHEFAVLALTAHALTLWRLRVPRRVRRGWAGAAAVVLAALLPLAVVSARQADRQLGWLGRPGPALWLQYAAVAGVCALLARWLLAAPGPADAQADRRTLVRLGLWLAVAPAGVLMTASLVKPWYVDRYVIYGMTGAALLAGLALDRAITRCARLTAGVRALVAGLALAAAMAVLVPWSLAVRSPESRKDDVVAVARAVRHVARPGDAVLFLPARRREWLLSRPALYGRLDDLALDRSPAASGTLQGTELPPEAIRRRLLAADRVVALSDPPGQPFDPFPREKVKREVLRRHFVLCARTRVHGAQVTVYARAGHCTR